METVLVISSVLTLAGFVVFMALMFWAAREDGRDQRRRDAAAGIRRRRDDA
jgi:hypothetical protein